MKSKEWYSLNKLISVSLYSCFIFLSVGIFWILIAEKNLIGIILTCIGILSGGFYIIYKLKEILNYIKKINWQKLGLKFYYVLIVIAVLFLINIIANKRSWRKDFTAGRRYTLSEHTLSLLKELEKKKKDIKMIFFRSEMPLTASVDDLLKEYKARCSVISLEFINPDKEPHRAKQYNIRSIVVNPYQQQRLYSTLIILSAGLKENIDAIKMDFRNVGGRPQPYPKIRENLEKDISSSLLRLTKSKKKIYFIYGHGEVDLADEDKSGWLEAKKVISEENYTIDKVYLAALGKVPNDCNVLVLGAPQKDYTDKEYEIINNYLNKGGQLLVLLEPFVKININKFLNKWGIKTSNKFVIDTGSSYWFQPIIPLITEYNFHKITEGLKYATFFPTLAPVEIMDDKPEGVNIQEIAKTTSDSWIEWDLNSKKIKYNAGIDKKGPITAIASVTKKINDEKEARIVVVGDSDFASNSSIKSYGNMDLLLNILNWLAGKEELIGIRSKPVENREIQLTAVKLKFIFYSCIIIFPLLIIVAGVIVWLKRR